MGVQIGGKSFPNLAIPGMYEIEYNCMDSKGMSATTVFKKIVVEDTICPRCSINEGPDTIEASFPYTDPGATCQDNIDGDLSDKIQVKSSVDVHNVGTYIVTYTVKDHAG